MAKTGPDFVDMFLFNREYFHGHFERRDSKTMCIFGASLSEPHIDRDNVPRRRECMYLACGVRLSAQCSREHAHSARA